MNFDLFRKFAEGLLGQPLESTQPRHLGGWEVVEAMWPLNEVFRPHFHAIQSLVYDATFEPSADAAIEAFVFRPDPGWESLPAGVWRVLLERHQQALVVAVTNEATGNPLMPIPSSLPKAAWQAAAMLFLLHGMKLPFPVADRSLDQLPPASALASLRRH